MFQFSYTTLHDKADGRPPYPIQNPTLIVNDNITIAHNDNIWVSTIKVGDSYFLHNDNEPALKLNYDNSVTYLFAHNGSILPIHMMPNMDDETKMFYTLKFGNCDTGLTYVSRNHL